MDVIRAIPQNFSGGQNPGVGANLPGGKNLDVGGGASINLRGLGGDATLTLLDGRRLSFDAALQSVDVSAIPFGAIERIEIVPDGSSALFGSDAVAGVANIILRRNFDGLETTARLGGSTDGGRRKTRRSVADGFFLAWGNGADQNLRGKKVAQIRANLGCQGAKGLYQLSSLAGLFDGFSQTRRKPGNVGT